MIFRHALLSVGVALLFQNIITARSFASEIQYAGRCTLTATPTGSNTLTPASRDFLVGWPWEINASSTIKTKLIANGCGKPRTCDKATTFSVEIHQGGMSVATTARKANANEPDGYRELTQVSLKTTETSRELVVKSEFPEIASLSYSCRRIPISEVLRIAQAENIDKLLTDLNCQTGDSGVEIGKRPTDNRNRQLNVTSTISSGNFSAEEIALMEQRGRFYDRDPKVVDETDKWIARLSPIIPLPENFKLTCEAPAPGAQREQLDTFITAQYKKLQAIMVSGLQIPRADADRIPLRRDMDCKERDALLWANGEKAMTPALSLKLSKEEALCMQRLCEKTLASRELVFPNRYFRTMVIDFRVDRWRALVSGSVQPFMTLPDGESSFIDEQYELHFIKVPAGFRPDALEIQIQIAMDRLKISREELLASDYFKKYVLSDEWKQKKEAIDRELTDWQNLQGDRMKNPGVTAIGKGQEVIPILNLRTDIPRETVEVEVPPQGKKPPTGNRTSSQTSKSKTRTANRPDRTVPDPCLIKGFSGRCYTKQQYDSNADIKEDVDIRLTFGDGRYMVPFFLRDDFPCGTLDEQTFKREFRNQNEALLAPVNAQFWGDTYIPSWNYKDEETIKCLETRGEQAYRQCNWEYTCRKAKAGGEFMSVPMGYYRGKQYKDSSDAYRRYLQDSVLMGDQKGEIEVIPFGTQYEDLKKKALACIYDKKACDISMSQAELDRMLMQAHGFSTIDEFKAFASGESNRERYLPWYNNLLRIVSDPAQFSKYLVANYRTGGLAVMTPPSQKGVPEEGIQALENPFRMMSDTAKYLRYSAELAADKKFLEALRTTNPLIRGMHLLNLQDTWAGQTIERSNAEFVRGSVQYIQSWTTIPMQNFYSALDGNDTLRKVFECTSPTRMDACLGLRDNRAEYTRYAGLLDTFNTKIEAGIQRPESLYCPPKNTICLENWARMAPALLGDTAIMLLSAPIPGGIYASGLLLASRQASDSYYQTLRARMREEGVSNWNQLSEAKKKLIVDESLRNGTQTFIVSAAATLAGMKIQAAGSAKIVGGNLRTANMSILNTTKETAEELTRRQLVVRTLLGETVIGLPVNAAQTMTDLVLKCKQLNQCDEATLKSALVTGMFTNAVMIGPAIARVGKAATKTGGADSDLVLTVDQTRMAQILQQATQQNARLREFQQNYSPDLSSAVGATRYVNVDGTLVAQRLMEIETGSGKFGWYEENAAAVKLEIEANPQKYPKAKKPRPEVVISSKADLQSDGTPKGFIGRVSKNSEDRSKVDKTEDRKPQETDRVAETPTTTLTLAQKRALELEATLGDLRLSELKFTKGGENRGIIQIDGPNASAGNLAYTLSADGTVLTVDSMFIDVNHQGRKLSELLLAKALAENPQVTRLEGALAFDNVTAYINALKGEGPNSAGTPKRKLTREEALQLTPMYRIREKLGFTDIDMSSFKVVVKENPDRVEIELAVNRTGTLKNQKPVPQPKDPLDEIPERFRNPKLSREVLEEGSKSPSGNEGAKNAEAELSSQISQLQTKFKALGLQLSKPGSKAERQRLRFEREGITRKINALKAQIKASQNPSSQNGKGKTTVKLSDYEASITGSVEPLGRPGTLTGTRSKMDNYVNGVSEKNRAEIDSKNRNMEYENSSADVLTDAGFNVEQNPVIPELRANPDYKINGAVFDHYSPRNSNYAGLSDAEVGRALDNIHNNIMNKVSADQADRIVLRLDESVTDVNVSQLRSRFELPDSTKIKELIIIRGTKVEHWNFGPSKVGERRSIDVSDIVSRRKVPRTPGKSNPAANLPLRQTGPVRVKGQDAVLANQIASTKEGQGLGFKPGSTEADIPSAKTQDDYWQSVQPNREFKIRVSEEGEYFTEAQMLDNLADGFILVSGKGKAQAHDLTAHTPMWASGKVPVEFQQLLKERAQEWRKLRRGLLDQMKKERASQVEIDRVMKEFDTDFTQPFAEGLDTYSHNYLQYVLQKSKTGKDDGMPPSLTLSKIISSSSPSLLSSFGNKNPRFKTLVDGYKQKYEAGTVIRGSDGKPVTVNFKSGRGVMDGLTPATDRIFGTKPLQEAGVPDINLQQSKHKDVRDAFEEYKRSRDGGDACTL